MTFEAPPGLKKNLLRTYEGWGVEHVEKGSVVRAQVLFVLAWFHAVVQERRKFIPHGWTKFYEFSPADLRAGADIIEACQQRGGGQLNWCGKRHSFEPFLWMIKRTICTKTGSGQTQAKLRQRGVFCRETIHGLFLYAVYGGRIGADRQGQPTNERAAFLAFILFPSALCTTWS